MSTVTTRPLSDSVGVEVLGADHDVLLHDPDFPAWCLAALEANGALVFRDLHLDDETQVAFARRLGEPETFGKGERPEIFVVTLDPAKSRSADYLRGTFDWHIDGMTEAVPIMATMLSARAVAAYVLANSVSPPVSATARAVNTVALIGMSSVMPSMCQSNVPRR